MVTAGVSGAITLATAACMQHANPIGPLDMPQKIDSTNPGAMNNQVIVHRALRQRELRDVGGGREGHVFRFEDLELPVIQAPMAGVGL